MELPSDAEPVVDDPSLIEESLRRASREDQVSAVLRVVDGFLEEEREEERWPVSAPQGRGDAEAERILVAVPGPGEPRGLVSQLSDFQYFVSDKVGDPLIWRTKQVSALLCEEISIQRFERSSS